MKYLLYYSDGFIKKFPLDKKSITVGRGDDNDLTIDDEFISRVHLKAETDGDEINIEDLESSNGTFVKTKKIKMANIKIGESFSCGGVEIFLKEGTFEEFKTTVHLAQVFNGIQKDNKQKFRPLKTKVMLDVYNEMLKQIIYTGLSSKDFSDFLSGLSGHLSGLKHFGSLFLISQLNKEINILFFLKRSDGREVNLPEIISKKKEIFMEKVTYYKIPGSIYHIHSFPVKIYSQNMVLLYISKNDQDTEEKKILTFLASLTEEFLLLSKLMKTGKPEKKILFEIEKKPNYSNTPEAVNIIASSDTMKALIEQGKKMARSNIFVLIQGESGTGKELFARLIHQHSSRHNKSFVAINCAAIPESLLESELFGYEKGAFTGAYSSKKGKLEIASGGTLLLDEIGDMPLSLQPKLLRALQENEFYRLGGTKPIKVDLRILSITNKNIGELIKSEKFRKDLYFRLVHRTILLPPLRERPEDISILINYFTNLFCKQCKKTINGYSLKAFQILQNYYWIGNIRQLENEIRSIVNLIENGEMVTHELISEEIKSDTLQMETKPVLLSEIKNKEAEKEIILQLLKKNDWNQSRTARELNMTYWGLHKKIKRIGIKIPVKKTNI